MSQPLAAVLWAVYHVQTLSNPTLSPPYKRTVIYSFILSGWHPSLVVLKTAHPFQIYKQQNMWVKSMWVTDRSSDT